MRPVTSHDIALLAYAYDRPVEIIDRWLASKGLTPGVPGYRAAFRVLADAYVAYAWDRYRTEGRICRYCGQILPAPRSQNTARTTTCSQSCARRQMARSLEEAA
jgi:hypothetical protein